MLITPPENIYIVAQGALPIPFVANAYLHVIVEMQVADALPIRTSPAFPQKGKHLLIGAHFIIPELKPRFFLWHTPPLRFFPAAPGTRKACSICTF